MSQQSEPPMVLRDRWVVSELVVDSFLGEAVESEPSARREFAEPFE